MASPSKKTAIVLEGPIKKLGHGRGKFYDRWVAENAIGEPARLALQSYLKNNDGMT